LPRSASPRFLRVFPRFRIRRRTSRHARARSALWRDCGLIRDAAGLEHLLTAPHLLTRLVAETALT
jgi:hypothetical protein